LNQRLNSPWLIFPFFIRNEDKKYMVLPYFWIPEDNLKLSVKRDYVPYDVWEKQGYLKTTEGNVVYYGFIETFIEELGKKYKALVSLNRIDGKLKCELLNIISNIV